IQGGVYLDLVARSARALVEGGFGFYALGSPTRVMENYMFTDLAKMVVAARKNIPYASPLHLFGAGHPLTMPLAVALGCDTFDSASYVLFARSNRYMTESGVLSLDSMKHLPCSCQVCMKASPKSLLELEHAERTRLLSLHNLYVLRAELEKCKEAISEGRLWDLVEEKSMAHPKLRASFSEVSAVSSLLAEGTPPLKDRGLFVRGVDDLARPELIHSAARLKRAMARRSGSAYLLSTGESPPKEGVQDFYKLSPVLGPYPAELDFVYPFGQTVVSGKPSPEAMVAAAKALRAMGYLSVAWKGSRKVRSRRKRRGASPSPR
ncbi:MAG TPA: tRNA-guanine transglycosylase, partial [Nitrososphaerales archaeon]|nr:tRNA-guanine transglycosylase [Nitrososphaerales archaeon]